MKNTRRIPPTHARAFTVLELVIALAMSSFVVLGAFAMLAMSREADRAASAATADSVELMRTQAVLRQATSSLLAAPPIPASRDEALENAADAEDAAGEDLPIELRRRLAALTGADAEDAAPGVDARLGLLVATADTSLPPWFELYFDEFEGVTTPRLSLTVADSPLTFVAGDRRDAGPTGAATRERLAEAWRGVVRGAFTVVWGGEQRGWMLVWQPERESETRSSSIDADEPNAVRMPAPDNILIDNITLLRFEVLMPLPDGDDDAPPVWQDVHAAYLQQDYPDAVRVVLETESGQSADWLFETIVTTAGR